MALASSGTIAIGGSTSGRSINLELGRSATATSSLGESALRTLAGVSSGAISMSNFHGASNALDTQTVTTGVSSYGYGFSTFVYNGNMGSISDGTANVRSGATIVSLSHSDGSLNGMLSFRLSGNYSNGGFTSLYFPSAQYTTTFNRTSASFSYSSYFNMTSWTWNGVPSPFGTSGSTTTVHFL
jgi:hypothetical protein